MPSEIHSPTTKQRQRAVAFAVQLAQGTPLEPRERELQLLQEYAAGKLTLSELETQISRLSADQVAL